MIALKKVCVPFRPTWSSGRSSQSRTKVPKGCRGFAVVVTAKPLQHFVTFVRDCEDLREDVAGLNGTYTFLNGAINYCPSRKVKPLKKIKS